ncbi:MAG: YigZ family protein [Thermodesulfobacteriota bacterium]|nr:YigZ family protein [Thermodesulfobacteriota bacterium]
MSHNRYPVPAKWHRVETEVKRSRFITTVMPTADREQSRVFVRQIRQEFADANHNCWARVIGAPGCTMEAGMSDDGEPQGAAGKPMLTTLLHANIGDITVVVSRYFGGIRLGKGGMVRAYTGAVLHALASLPTVDKIDYRPLQLILDYSLLEQVQRLYKNYEVKIEQHSYTDQVQIDLQLPREHIEAFKLHLTELSHGRISITQQP